MQQLTHGFRTWVGGRSLETLGTNAGASLIPFQNWRKFKEAFAPELIGRAVSEHPGRVSSILDPFGGSGTTALASQFLGIHPTTIEVNPFLADLIEAKLTHYEHSAIGPALKAVLDVCDTAEIDPREFFSSVPPTFIEPGVKGRWLFGLSMAAEAAALLSGISHVNDPAVRRLFRVLLGPVLVDASNVVVSGKGRRYRQNWQQRTVTGVDLRQAFVDAVGKAASDIARFSSRAECDFTLHRGDSRLLIQKVENADLAIYSPPYPNSFDYTDVYNVELWMLGYLRKGADNQMLRSSTLSSHVQLARAYPPAPNGSSALDETMQALRGAAPLLWNRHIPSMIGAYFSEMIELICGVNQKLTVGGRQWLVVGDSRYAGIDVNSRAIVTP